MRKGIHETLQLEMIISTHPKEMHGFLVASSSFDVTVDFLIDSFVIHYSEPGHNKRTYEESIMLEWCDCVMECAGVYVVYLLTFLLLPLTVVHVITYP